MLRLLAVVCSLLFAASTFSAENDTYYIAVSDDNFLPYTWIEDGIFHGADRAVLDAFAKQQQIKLIYLPLPRLRALELMKDGTVDLIYPDDHYWAFDAKQGMAIEYSNYGMSNQAGFFRLRETLCDPNFSIIGSQHGWMPDDYRDKVESGEVSLHRFATLDQLLEAGRTGQVEAIFSERYILGAHIQRQPRYQELEFCESLPSSIGKFRLSTIKHPEVLVKFNQFLRTSPDVIEQIRKRYRLL